MKKRLNNNNNNPTPSANNSTAGTNNSNDSTAGTNNNIDSTAGTNNNNNKSTTGTNNDDHRGGHCEFINPLEVALEKNLICEDDINIVDGAIRRFLDYLVSKRKMVFSSGSVVKSSSSGTPDDTKARSN